MSRQDTPLFTVVIPLYNKEKSISSTIESVLAQQYTHFELVVVNDGSTDKSLAMAQQFDDERIRIIDKPNGGVSSARNAGIEAAKGEYIALLDGDDLMFPNHLSTLAEMIENLPGAQVFATRYIASGHTIPSKEGAYYISNYFLAEIREFSLVGYGIICSSCVAIKRSCFDEVGLFNTSKAYGEDKEMWKRLADKYTIAKSRRVTAQYRTEAENRALNRAETTTIARQRIQRSDCTHYSEKLGMGYLILRHFIASLRHRKVTFEQLKRVITNIDVVACSGIYALYCRLQGDRL